MMREDFPEHVTNKIKINMKNQYNDKVAALDLESQLAHLRQINCKNAEFAGEVVRVETPGVGLGFSFESAITSSVCENERRDGSAYCQECSDKHNK